MPDLQAAWLLLFLCRDGCGWFDQASPCASLTEEWEEGGRWRQRSSLGELAKFKSRAVPELMRKRVTAWLDRWRNILSCNAVQAFAISWLDQRPVVGAVTVPPSMDKAVRKCGYTWRVRLCVAAARCLDSLDCPDCKGCPALFGQPRLLGLTGSPCQIVWTLNTRKHFFFSLKFFSPQGIPSYRK